MDTNIALTDLASGMAVLIRAEDVGGVHDVACARGKHCHEKYVWTPVFFHRTTVWCGATDLGAWGSALSALPGDDVQARTVAHVSHHNADDFGLELGAVSVDLPHQEGPNPLVHNQATFLGMTRCASRSQP